jgi:glycosyltransferase involved in cell wall biosynthesis
MTERENWVERYSSKNWFGILNTPGARILTPTQWNKTVWEDAGVTNPIQIVPCGIDYLKFQKEKGLLKRSKFEKFTFFSVFNGLGDPSSREQWQIIITAMERAFGDDNNVQWLVKTNKVHPDFIPSSKIEMRIIDDPGLSESQMVDLYCSSHAFVKNSVEGWGMPTMEAMALGLPILHSYNTAPMEYLNAANSFLFDPFDTDTLIKHLKFVRHNVNSEIVQRTVRAADTTARAYSWESASLKLIHSIFND